MTGKTHQVGGEFCVVAGFIFLNQNGYLLKDVNPYLQLLTMYPFAIWGSKALDLDHGEGSIPMRDIFSRFIHKLLHLTKNGYQRAKVKLDDPNVSAKDKRTLRKSLRYKFYKFFNASHRSWQTHSDLTLAVIVGLLASFNYIFLSLGIIDQALMHLILVGTTLGMLSHLVLDALTTDGIHLLLTRLINVTVFRKVRFQLPEKLHLVPRSKRFSCESKWESFVKGLLSILTILSLGYLVITLECPDLPSNLILKLYNILKGVK